MELKVWVEGIQRVVCGVSETTTCQDVVYALAHATGQTGRFTLVERWRHNERLLPPQEYPLKVLNKWGEYANDVQFILRRSHSDKKKSQAVPPTNPNTISSNKRHHELRSFSPTSPTNTPSVAGASSNHNHPLHNKLEIKKSLTFSGSHGGGSSGESGHSTPNNLHPTLMSPKSEHSHSKSRNDVPKGVVKGVQQQKGPDSPTKSKNERPKQPPSYDEAVSRSARQSSQMHPSPPIISSPIPSPANEKDSPTSKRRHVAHHISQSPSHSNQQRVSRDQTTGKRENSPIVASLSPARIHEAPPKQWTEQSNNAAGSKNAKSRKNLEAELVEEDKQGQDQKENNQNIEGIGPQDPQFRDLIRLVNLQREKLNSQHAELSQYDSEIVYWETKLQEQEERLASVEEELHLLEKKNLELEDELRQLEDHQPLFLEAIDKGRQEDRSLRSKLSVIRAQLANCETEALQCRQKMRQLLEELAEERRRGVAEREEQEQEAKRQLQDLKEELVKHNEESDKQKTTLDRLEEELKDLENKINDKKLDVDKVTEEMREANLQSLSMTISEDIKLMAEGSFHNRSGSMRRIMGSPRQLENAVPTSKNPHGVWV